MNENHKCPITLTLDDVEYERLRELHALVNHAEYPTPESLLEEMLNAGGGLLVLRDTHLYEKLLSPPVEEMPSAGGGGTYGTGGPANTLNRGDEDGNDSNDDGNV